MRLDEIIRGIEITDRRGSLSGQVTGVEWDSRKVEPGQLFVAVRGASVDGHDYIANALAAGATAVLAEHWPDSIRGERAAADTILVKDSRKALAFVADNFFGRPSRRLLLAGVTGTNGKTTVTYLLESMLRAAGRSVGVIGTLGCRYAGRTDKEATHTTPDAVTLQRQLAKMLAEGVSHVAMEVSSHALDQQRVAGAHFKVVGFTNLSPEHLDYHHTMEAYFEAKCRLFSDVLRKSRSRGRMAVVNIDDPAGERILERWTGKTLRVSIHDRKDADIAVLASQFSLSGTTFTVRTPKGTSELRTNLIGEHNLSNTVVALGMAMAMGLSNHRIKRGLEGLERIPGRLESVPNQASKRIFVDYAHTPDALQKTLDAVKPFVKGRLMVVFGCGGDRDTSKREVMGRIAAVSSDLAIITSDNPRSEDPGHIVEQIERGFRAEGWSKVVFSPENRKYAVELDRLAAIERAIGWLESDDVLVIAGKGHEAVQIIGTRRNHFSDTEEVERVLSGRSRPGGAMVEDVEDVGLDSILAERDESRMGPSDKDGR
jgi:UDP-N-acetylmuramoyl-L-alanyl-D-glutamate--2,6-diaminopimelate ligase